MKLSFFYFFKPKVRLTALFFIRHICLICCFVLSNKIFLLYLLNPIKLIFKYNTSTTKLGYYLLLHNFLFKEFYIMVKVYKGIVLKEVCEGNRSKNIKYFILVTIIEIYLYLKERLH